MPPGPWPERPRRRARLPPTLALIGSALTAPGCGDQSALEPRSDAARAIETLWWWMLAAASVVIAGALFLLALAWLRRDKPGFPLVGRREGVATGMVLVFGIAIPAASLIALFVAANFVVADETDAPDPATTPMTIEVTGHQFWWEIRYPGTTAVTANELHIPVGTRVNVVARSADVVHSLWVPQLNRKIDTLPGHPNRMLLQADAPGRYRGQCAELCGEQHSHMGLYVFADPPERFQVWLRNMEAGRSPPTTAEQRRGEDVFLDNACASCHTIRGTAARGEIGPDLTHLANRSTLAALTIPNRRGYLGAWIRDPQHFKPGNRMPALDLAGPELNDLVAYLESLR